MHGLQEGHRDQNRPGNLHQRSTVLRRKYGAFLFAEAGFWGAALLRLHRFQVFAGGSYTPPTFDFTLFSKRNALNKNGIQLF